MKRASILFFIINMIYSLCSYAQEEATKNKDQEKTYTQKEYDEKLKKDLMEKIERYRPSNLVELSSELLKRERQLELRELSLKKSEEQVVLNEKELTKKIKELQKQEVRVLGCIDQNDQDKKKRVSHMVDVVSGMRPATAAEVLSVQDAEISVRILELLSPQKVSKIFNSMNKEISARLQKQFMNMKK